MIDPSSIIPPLESLSPTYRSALENLVIDLNSSPNVKSKEKLFDKFITKFTTIPYIWERWNRYISSDSDLQYNEKEKKKKTVYEKALSHFYLPFFVFNLYGYNDKYWKKLLQFRHLFSFSSIKESPYSLQKLDELMFLPNKNLSKYREEYDEFSSKPISKELEIEYKNSLKLYEKIIAVENDNEKWLNCLKEVKDDKFIIQNIEARLGVNPIDKHMWLLYLTFLEQKEYIEWMLNVYSRYCRLFIDDLNMRKEYRKKIKITQVAPFDAIKWIIDSIKFELDFVSPTSAFQLFIEYFGKDLATENNFKIVFKQKFDDFQSQHPMGVPKYLMNDILHPLRKTEKVDFQNTLLTQKIDLPLTILYYLMKSSNSSGMQKLYTASKQFFLMFKVAICHRWVTQITDIPWKSFSYEQLLFTSIFFDFNNLPKIYLTNSLEIWNGAPWGHLFTSKIIIPKLYKCEIRYLRLNGQTLTLKEFIFLVKYVEKLRFDESHVVINENSDIDVSVNKIIDQMPNVMFLNFQMNSIPFEQISGKNENNIYKKTQIKELWLHSICESINLENLLKFIVKYANLQSDFHFSFKAKYVSSEYIRVCKEYFKGQLPLWNLKPDQFCFIV